MSQNSEAIVTPKRLHGGAWGPILTVLIVLTTIGLVLALYVYPHYTRAYGKNVRFNRAMFGPALAQPIAFSHRLHVTDKEIDCFYCHSTGERSLNAGFPAVHKCLGCHNYIIPDHEEIQKLKHYAKEGRPVPWKRVYYKPDHVFFPHYRHLLKGVECKECHGEVQEVDRLRKVTFYMGLCIDCHRQRNAPNECVTCHM